jgi:hypothetical protein
MYHDVVITKSSGNSVNVSFDDLNGRTIEQIKLETDASSVTKPSTPWIRATMAINGILLLVVGIYYRKKENKIIAVWNAIEMSGEAKVDDLVNSLGIERDFILANLKWINAQHSALYILDQSSNKIIDGRLNKEYPVTIECENCGAKSEERISLAVLRSPKCIYCGSVLTTPEHFEELKNKILGKSKHQEFQHQSVPTKAGFNVGLFIVLLVFFWPGAIYYAVKKNS